MALSTFRFDRYCDTCEEDEVEALCSVDIDEEGINGVFTARCVQCDSAVGTVEVMEAYYDERKLEDEIARERVGRGPAWRHPRKRPAANDGPWR